jgi:hypothetical protein
MVGLTSVGALPTSALAIGWLRRGAVVRRSVSVFAGQGQRTGGDAVRCQVIRLVSVGDRCAWERKWGLDPMASGVDARECWIGLDERTGVIGARPVEDREISFALIVVRGWVCLRAGTLVWASAGLKVGPGLAARDRRGRIEWFTTQL